MRLKTGCITFQCRL